MIKVLSIVFALTLLQGCAVKTTVIAPDGSEYTVISKKDSLVVLNEKEYTLTIDNRGNIGLIQQVLTGILLNIEIPNKKMD